MTTITLDSLPNEMILHIASDVDDYSLLSLLLCSRTLYNLLEHVLDIRALAPRGDLSAMQWAAAHGHLSLVHLLIIHRMHPDTGATDTQPPALFYAVQAGNLEMVQLLISFGADIDSPNYNDNYCYEAVIYTAVANGDANMIRLLASYGADVVSDNQDRAYVRTPLHAAVCGGHVSAVEALLESGAEVDVVDFDSETPLEIVESMACSAVVVDEELWERMVAMGELLVAAGAYVREVVGSLDRFPDEPRTVEFLRIMAAAQQRAASGA